MRGLLGIAILLLILWALARVLGWAIGVALNLLWIIALVLLVIWLIGMITGRGRTTV